MSRIYHFYRGVNAAQETVLCGGTVAARARHTNEPTQVTCQRCQAGLRRRGLLPRVPTTSDAPRTVQSPPSPARASRPVHVDADDVDNQANWMLRLGIM